MIKVNEELSEKVTKALDKSLDEVVSIALESGKVVVSTRVDTSVVAPHPVAPAQEAEAEKAPAQG
jgi:hypothetical protein